MEMEQMDVVFPCSLDLSKDGLRLVMRKWI